MPDVQVPAIEVPDVQAPEVQVPDLPSVDEPEVTLPDVRTPDVGTTDAPAPSGGAGGGTTGDGRRRRHGGHRRRRRRCGLADRVGTWRRRRIRERARVHRCTSRPARRGSRGPRGGGAAARRRASAASGGWYATGARAWRPFPLASAGSSSCAPASARGTRGRGRRRPPGSISPSTWSAAASVPGSASSASSAPACGAAGAGGILTAAGEHAAASGSPPGASAERATVAGEPADDGAQGRIAVLGEREALMEADGAPSTPAVLFPDGVVPPGDGELFAYVLAGLALTLLVLLGNSRSRDWILRPDR